MEYETMSIQPEFAETDISFADEETDSSFAIVGSRIPLHEASEHIMTKLIKEKRQLKKEIQDLKAELNRKAEENRDKERNLERSFGIATLEKQIQSNQIDILVKANTELEDSLSNAYQELRGTRLYLERSQQTVANLEKRVVDLQRNLNEYKPSSPISKEREEVERMGEDIKLVKSEMISLLAKPLMRLPDKMSEMKDLMKSLKERADVAELHREEERKQKEEMGAQLEDMRSDLKQIVNMMAGGGGYPKHSTAATRTVPSQKQVQSKQRKKNTSTPRGAPDTPGGTAKVQNHWKS
ncbi:hypothetical protein MAR_029186 [Mya arenaria]|uniref:Uncharacterized protein n=1 Tax=Mya arenaria TaxID=6604 RepID=A0ABY7DFP7_MYAAR|nr:centromere-associated protein E-like [Mya arenaria]WAQ96496.1 hypothetical protein MAR_029186 [Mya arenaria]